MWQGIRFLSLFMLGSYLLFFFGYAWYKHQELVGESNVGKFYRVCKAAYRKRNLAYLTSSSAGGYYWKNCNQGYLYEANKHGRIVIRLLPRVPWGFRWLDKAAIVDNKEHCEDQEMKGVLCTVKQVRETKSVVVLLCWGVCFFAYSFVSASGNSFFVSQANNLESFTSNDVSLLFLFKSIMSDIATPAFFWLVKKAKIANKINRRKIIDLTTMKIGIGMFVAAICCVFAWNVENQTRNSKGMMNTTVMIPQFLLLGMAEALVGDGLSKLFENYASESVRNFAEPFSKLVTGIGKLLSIAWFLIFRGWVNESDNASSRHLDRYFLMLAGLNLVFLLLFLLYYYRFVYNNEFPEDNEEMMEDHSLESDLEEANGAAQNLTSSQGPEVHEMDSSHSTEERATREQHLSDLTTIFNSGVIGRF
ncbi:hypothetical protein PIB30_060067, partial [Stylosanthes scabra]|nr:hypothetical protein [Stylosanthes scabra]